MSFPTSTSASGIWTLKEALQYKAAGQWPRGPVAPTSLAGTRADTEVALTWVAPATTHGTITNYAVEYTPSGGSPAVVLTGSTSASYTVTGLTNDTEYTFRVAGVNHTQGEWSDAVAVTPSSAPTDPDFASVELLLHFDGSNGSTTFTDSSSNALTVTPSGGSQISTSQSKFGGSSGRLNGGADYLTFSGGDSFGTGDFCVEFWIYSDWVGDMMLFDFRSHASLALWTNGTSLIFFNSGTFAARATLTANTWQHLAVSRSGSTIRLFVDGVQQYSATDSGNFNTGGGTNWIGKPYDAFWSTPDFWMDELRMSRVARYTADFTPPTAAFPDA